MDMELDRHQPVSITNHHLITITIIITIHMINSTHISTTIHAGSVIKRFRFSLFEEV
ncbi:hypothetical protein [Alicyclobacillus ferrooxydans]|uniref:hypothetical protein n=1 Tax=Alicyclobacillus ferrooxydans TaxID=471514 RepID=UPI000AA2EB70|nr:hypothetical protein [Alicyclobacillus ferrooxydans]